MFHIWRFHMCFAQAGCWKAQLWQSNAMVTVQAMCYVLTTCTVSRISGLFWSIAIEKDMKMVQEITVGWICHLLALGGKVLVLRTTHCGILLIASTETKVRRCQCLSLRTKVGRSWKWVLICLSKENSPQFPNIEVRSDICYNIT